MERAVAKLRHLVGRRHRAEHREGRAAAGIGGKADPVAALRQPVHVEEAGADEGVGGRAVDQARVDFPQPVDLARFEMDDMAVKPAGSEQPVPFVGVEIVARRGVERFHPGDLVGLLREVGLHQAVGMRGPERAQGLKLSGRRGRRKARSYDVGEPALPVPALQKPLALVMGRLRRVAQPLGRGVAVHAGLAGKGAQAALFSLGEEGIDAFGMDGAVGTDRRGPVREREVEIPRGDFRRIGRVAEARLLGEGVALQPVDQPLAPTRDDRGLGVMDMGIDEAGGDERITVIGDARLRIGAAQVVGLAHRSDAVADDPDIGPPGFVARAIDHQAIAYQDIEAAHFIAPRRRRLCGAIITARSMR